LIVFSQSFHFICFVSQGFKLLLSLVFCGGSYYIGDLNPAKHFVYSKPAFGAIFRYNLTTRYSLRFTATYGNVYASDADADDPFMVQRNLSFKSDILELAFGVELESFQISHQRHEIPNHSLFLL
jgi:hypothetical protein